MQDPDRTSHTLTCHRNSRKAANAKKRETLKVSEASWSAFLCTDLESARKQQGRPNSKTLPRTHPGRLVKRVPLDSFSLTEKVAGVQMRVSPAGKNVVATKIIETFHRLAQSSSQFDQKKS